MCEDVEQGESKLADCLSEAIAEAENADSGGERAGRQTGMARQMREPTPPFS